MNRCFLICAGLIGLWLPQNGNSQKTILVSNAADLQTQLANAKAGTVVQLKDGLYQGNFSVPKGVNGTIDKPIVLKGGPKAILDGGGTDKGYVFHLESDHWLLKGFTIINGLKGIVLDNASNNTLESLDIHDIGEEGVHFRKSSCKNLLTNCTVKTTGLKNPQYGEAVYIGSAINHWKEYGTTDKGDPSDSNSIIGNTLGPDIGAECIDIKEGTTGGLIKGNRFDSKGISGQNSADSWIDVKGNGYLITENIGTNPQGSVLMDGYQVHCAWDGWGNNNVFSKNRSTVNAEGYGFNIVSKSSKGTATGNVVTSDNTVEGAAKGIANIPLSKP